MSAEIVPFRPKAVEEEPAPGSDAREAIERYFAEYPIHIGISSSRTDHLLTWLWCEGFEVVPTDPDNSPG